MDDQGVSIKPTSLTSDRNVLDFSIMSGKVGKAIASIRANNIFKKKVGGNEILDLPIEVFQMNIFPYLSNIDIYNLGMAGSQMLKELSVDYIINIRKARVKEVFEVYYLKKFNRSSLVNQGDQVDRSIDPRRESI